jgi:hypothetical protein
MVELSEAREFHAAEQRHFSDEAEPAEHGQQQACTVLDVDRAKCDNDVAATQKVQLMAHEALDAERGKLGENVAVRLTQDRQMRVATRCRRTMLI